jgi:hypothetical protein
MKRSPLAAVVAAAFAAAGLTLAPAPEADAASVFLQGTIGYEPDWATIDPGAFGQDCTPCSSTSQEIVYDTWPSQDGIADGVDALKVWFNDGVRTSSDTVWAYSLGTHAAIGYIRDNQLNSETYNVKFILIAAPETPGNGNQGNGHKNTEGLPNNWFTYDNVTFVVVQYDAIADAPAQSWNLLARLNASMSIHMEGYDDLDLDAYDAIYIDPVTQSRTLYFTTKVLPILAPLDWLLSDSAMAELDAIVRPMVEEAYSRPVELPDPWAPSAPSALAQSASTTPTVDIEPDEAEVEVAEPTPDVSESEPFEQAPESADVEASDDDETIDEVEEAEVEADEIEAGEPEVQQGVEEATVGEDEYTESGDTGAESDAEGGEA